MASGDTLIIFTALHGVPPATLGATFDIHAGGSTPVESVPVIDFDDSASEYMDFYGVMPQNYADGGLTLTIVFATPGETVATDEVRWEVAFRSIEDDAEDIDTSHTYVYNGVSADPPSVAGEFAYESGITFTDGADMDNVDAGDAFVLRIYRDHDHADDTATGDAELLAIHIKET